MISDNLCFVVFFDNTMLDILCLRNNGRVLKSVKKELNDFHLKEFLFSFNLFARLKSKLGRRPIF